jgi:Domain of unknown function (DUF4189)
MTRAARASCALSFVATVLFPALALADVTAIAVGARSNDPDDLAATWFTAKTNAEAIRGAIDLCKQDGGTDCQVLQNLTFEACAAVSADDQLKLHFNVERTRRESEEAALRSCGNSSCHVLISHCR